MATPLTMAEFSKQINLMTALLLKISSKMLKHSSIEGKKVFHYKGKSSYDLKNLLHNEMNITLKDTQSVGL